MGKPHLLPTPKFYERISLWGEEFFGKFQRHPKLYATIYFVLLVASVLFEHRLAVIGNEFIDEHMDKVPPFIGAIYRWVIDSGLGILGLIIVLFTLVLIGHAYWETRPSRKRAKDTPNPSIFTIRREQTEKIADFIEEGKHIQKLYRKPEGSLRNEVKVWLTRVRDYLQENFGRAAVTQWEDEEGLTPITPPPVMLLRDQKAFQVLSYRLTRLRELLTKLMDQRGQL